MVATRQKAQQREIDYVVARAENRSADQHHGKNKVKRSSLLHPIRTHRIRLCRLLPLLGFTAVLRAPPGFGEVAIRVFDQWILVAMAELFLHSCIARSPVAIVLRCPFIFIRIALGICHNCTSVVLWLTDRVPGAVNYCCTLSLSLWRLSGKSD